MSGLYRGYLEVGGTSKWLQNGILKPATRPLSRVGQLVIGLQVESQRNAVISTVDLQVYRVLIEGLCKEF